MTPPASPLPEPSADPDWYGQFWLRYPLDPILYTTHFPHLFKAQSGFSIVIIEGWNLKTRVRELQDDPAMTAPLINVYYNFHMKQWLHGLPEPLRPTQITLPSHLILQ
jgi:hypothetical protein